MLQILFICVQNRDRRMRPDTLTDSVVRNRGEIDLWITRLIATSGRLRDFEDRCSEDEKRRADGFRLGRLRESFVIGRGLLRSILSSYIGQRPDDLQFQYGPKGKPLLRSNSEQTLYFNLAHSENLAICAVSRDCELGVDVERVRDLADLISIAKHFFTEPEYLDIMRLAPAQRAEGFFNCWTRKEAFLKAIGDGLSVPLNEFQVSLAPGDPAAFRTYDGAGQRLSGWSLFHLQPAAGYVGAVAVPLSDCFVDEHKFSTASSCLEYLGARRS